MDIDGTCLKGAPHYCPNCDNTFIWNPPKLAPEPSSAALEALRAIVATLRERTWLSPVSAEDMNHRDRWLADQITQALTGGTP